MDTFFAAWRGAARSAASQGVLAAALALGLAACASSSSSTRDAAPSATRSTSASADPVLTPESSPTPTTPASDPVLAPTSAGLPAVVVPPDVVLPDRARTPGAINLAVTQATIATTICVPGFTATIRPTSTYTTDLKRQQLASGYTLAGDTNTADYEEDHLVSLELGGNPTDPRNLWPQPYAATGARLKDRVENRLHELVCAGSLPLSIAQADLATNWYAAYIKYVGPIGSPSASPQALAPASTAPTTSS
ncbi:MAG: hypothetical protein NVSMB13_04710 [Mycobacteriales bacterium]